MFTIKHTYITNKTINNTIVYIFIVISEVEAGSRTRLVFGFIFLIILNWNLKFTIIEFILSQNISYLKDKYL